MKAKEERTLGATPVSVAGVTTPAADIRELLSAIEI
jgi:hypothetical protein